MNGFNLLNTNNYYSRIDSSAFEDLGIKSLFDDFYDSNWNALEDVMSKICDSKEIQSRQNIFTDFLNDKENKLSIFKRLLVEVWERYKNYQHSDGGLIHYVNFYLYQKALMNFIREGFNILKSLDLKSEKMINMKDTLKSIIDSDVCIALNSDITGAENAYNSIRTFVVSYKMNEDNIKVNRKNDKKAVYLFAELKSCADMLGINLPNYASNTLRHPLDSYYFNRLEYIFTQEVQTLKDFYESFKDKIEIDYETLYRDLNYYLRFKELFIYAKDKNVPYSKAKINDEYVTNISDMRDITIINKVSEITANDFSYTLDHHIQIVTGANGGGKTTFLRSIGANYIIFSALGYTFSAKAAIKPIKFIKTHFPNDENYHIGYGRLEDEIMRLKDIKKSFCEDCLFLSNETFSSTDEDTAFKESKRLFDEIEEKQVNMIFITHQQKIINYINKDKVILLNPIVDTEHGNKRTFKIKPVENKIHAFAQDILRKYGLAKDQLERSDNNV